MKSCVSVGKHWQSQWHTHYRQCHPAEEWTMAWTEILSAGAPSLPGMAFMEWEKSEVIVANRFDPLLNESGWSSDIVKFGGRFFMAIAMQVLLN
jgi:hypothetical protein